LPEIPFLTTPKFDIFTFFLVGSVLLLLAMAGSLVFLLRGRFSGRVDPSITETFALRVRGWWFFFSGLIGAYLLDASGAFCVILFAVISFWALREFITLTPTRRGDHRTLFWVFFVLIPLQYLFVLLDYRELFTIFIPVYAFLIIPARVAIAGDPKKFLERTAKIQVGVLICIYCLSFAPAIWQLGSSHPQAYKSEIYASAASPSDSPTDTKKEGSLTETIRDLTVPSPAMVDQDSPTTSYGFRLLFFFVIMAQLSDAFFFAWSKLPNGHKIAPGISATKTWEGLFGSVATMMFIGALLWWATPFPVQVAGMMGGLVAIMNFAGTLTLAAVKRDRGVEDFGTLVAGHSGVLDRIDSLCFAAPIFYYTSKFWLGIAG